MSPRCCCCCCCYNEIRNDGLDSRGVARRYIPRRQGALERQRKLLFLSTNRKHKDKWAGQHLHARGHLEVPGNNQNFTHPWIFTGKRFTLEALHPGVKTADPLLYPPKGADPHGTTLCRVESSLSAPPPIGLGWAENSLIHIVPRYRQVTR